MLEIGLIYGVNVELQDKLHVFYWMTGRGQKVAFLGGFCLPLLVSYYILLMLQRALCLTSQQQLIPGKNPPASYTPLPIFTWPLRTIKKRGMSWRRIPAMA